jgi:hypothetical protein
VFEGGCVGTGDLVSDTPAQLAAGPLNLCPTSPPPNTCPNVDGDDPIRNYMNYATDACRNKFTDGQFERMKQKFDTYRAGTVPRPGGPIPNGVVQFMGDYGSVVDPARPRGFEYRKPNGERVLIYQQSSYNAQSASEGSIQRRGNTGFYYTPNQSPSYPDGRTTVYLSGPGYSATQGNVSYKSKLSMLVNGAIVRTVTAKLTQGDWLKIIVDKSNTSIKACAVAGVQATCTPY